MAAKKKRTKARSRRTARKRSPQPTSERRITISITERQRDFLGVILRGVRAQGESARVLVEMLDLFPAPKTPSEADPDVGT